MDVYVEVGQKRVFAGAVDWPGWARSARDEDGALAALLAYAPRYAAAVAGVPGKRFAPPATVQGLKVVERLKGDATTDFGALSIAPAADQRPLKPAEVRRQLAILDASWAALDAAAAAAVGLSLRRGPRGGGRELDAIVDHVRDADRGYLSALGGRPPKGAVPTAEIRQAFRDAVVARAQGEPPAPSRRTKPPWTPRYAVRRSAWHALDHAWEIEDRAGG